ncbi:MAG: 2-hydroxychromene-2-carboxylate isomerase [Aestuariibacter sp.]
MTRNINFFYDFISPYSYLANTQLSNVVKGHEVSIAYKPIHILSVMASVGNRPTTVECAAKGKYAMSDLTRWCKRYRVPLVPNPNFRSIDSRPLLLGALSASNHKEMESYNNAIFKALWVEKEALTEDQEIIDILKRNGIRQAESIWNHSKVLSDELDQMQKEAISAGVFGVPSFVFDGGLYFGNDRLDFLKEAISL